MSETTNSTTVPRAAVYAAYLDEAPTEAGLYGAPGTPGVQETYWILAQHAKGAEEDPLVAVLNIDMPDDGTLPPESDHARLASVLREVAAVEGNEVDEERAVLARLALRDLGWDSIEEELPEAA